MSKHFLTVDLHDDIGQLLTQNIIGIDIGGTLAKVVYVLHESVPTKRQNDTLTPSIQFGYKGQVFNAYFAFFQTSKIQDLIDFVKDSALVSTNGNAGCLRVTGGGAFKFYGLLQRELKCQIFKCDEMQSVMSGLHFVLAGKDTSFSYDLDRNRKVIKGQLEEADSFLLVNIGSGVSILKAEKDGTFARVSGTCIGGGTALGLCKLCFGANSFEEVVELSEKGSETLDLRVSDVLGDTAGSRTLPTDTLASSFGRLSIDPTIKQRLRKEDIARSAIKMISYNLGYLALLVARIHNVRRIFFSGKYISDHAFTMKTITQAMTFYHLYINNPSGRELNAWAVSDSELKECEQQETRFDTFVANLQKNLTDEYEALFLRHDGYLGAIGALLSTNEGTVNAPIRNSTGQE